MVNKANQTSHLTDPTLEKHLKSNRIAPSYLIIDADIVKTRKVAEWFSTHYNPADIFWLTNDQTNSIQVKETQEFISQSNLSAVGERGKLMIICDASNMTTPAQNKILKTIEDAQTDTFIIIASNENKILNTIKSRCVIIYPNPHYVTINVDLTNTSLSKIIPIKTTLTIKRKIESNSNSQKIFESIYRILFESKTLDDALTHIPTINSKDNLPITLTAFSILLKQDLSQTNPCFTLSKHNAILKALTQVNRNIASNCNPTNAFDLLLIALFNGERL